MASIAVGMALLCLLVSSSFASAEAAAAAVHHKAISDREQVERKTQCYREIDNGLWGYACKSSPIDKENCALICVSSPCYESIYGNDPLEEGELDWRRGREFKACIRGIIDGSKSNTHLWNQFCGDGDYLLFV